ncbi:hypothetical protein QMK33_18780 [Hymenobacter sp. H14-R3]|uniref:hypothetical protein n=1 Tax=Hymenobacter sp. H14-R3 TaxID=3046308 RepID=UPI0024B900DD|nr:hypothetical protein [Hymenobacter sp. H14-R3]MDJ0367199.1 hypothetical protein [Hymenobacter sp. H14-R3]
MILILFIYTLFIIHFYIYKKVLYLASLAGLPLLSGAQTTPSSARFYVGVGANLLTNAPFNSAGTPKLVGPSLTAGLKLAPRLAVQISAAYQWQHKSYTYPDYTYGSSAIGSLVTADYRYKYFTVPVLLRYTFTEPAERLYFDGLAGITFLHSTFNSTVTGSLGSYGYYPTDYSSSSIKANLTLGPAVRYSVASNVELTANGLVSAVLGDTYYRFSDRLFLNVLVGTHYTFGAR